MTTIKAFTKRHPLVSYFALTFAISWVGSARKKHTHDAVVQFLSNL